MQAEEKGKCCPDGAWPALKTDYEGKGQQLQIGGTSVYHVGDSSKILIIISDIFGASSGRHRNVADTYAAEGYNVYLPEILVQPYGGEMDMSKIIASIKSQNWQTMEQRFAALRQYLIQKGHKQFVSVGFCWGVYAVFKFASKYDGFKAIVAMHPSLGICGMFQENQLQLTKSIKCPAYFMPAGNDAPNVKTDGDHLKILAQRFGEEKVGTTEFPDQMHGWVVRGDVKIEACHQDTQKAIKLSLDYFSKFS